MKEDKHDTAPPHTSEEEGGEQEEEQEQEQEEEQEEEEEEEEEEAGRERSQRMSGHLKTRSASSAVGKRQRVSSAVTEAEGRVGGGAEHARLRQRVNHGGRFLVPAPRRGVGGEGGGDMDEGATQRRQSRRANLGSKPDEWWVASKDASEDHATDSHKVCKQTANSASNADHSEEAESKDIPLASVAHSGGGAAGARRLKSEGAGGQGGAFAARRVTSVLLSGGSSFLFD
jgi:hypothetical protein